MTRKDYVLIAEALKAARTQTVDRDRKILRPDIERSGIERAAVCIAAALWHDNARFDRARFLQACGVES